jgi:hypothetical protein
LCRAVSEKLGIPYEGPFDVVRWSIEETLCWDPFQATQPDPRFEADPNIDAENWRYFHTREAPAHTPLPPLVATFRIAQFPRFGERGLIEGREVWVEEDLRQIGFALENDATLP